MAKSKAQPAQLSSSCVRPLSTTPLTPGRRAGSLAVKLALGAGLDPVLGHIEPCIVSDASPCSNDTFARQQSGSGSAIHTKISRGDEPLDRQQPTPSVVCWGPNVCMNLRAGYVVVCRACAVPTLADRCGLATYQRTTFRHPPALTRHGTFMSWARWLCPARLAQEAPNCQAFPRRTSSGRRQRNSSQSLTGTADGKNLPRSRREKKKRGSQCNERATTPTPLIRAVRGTNATRLLAVTQMHIARKLRCLCAEQLVK